MESARATFAISTAGVAGQIIINGDDVSTRVSRVVVELAHDAPARVGLELSPGAEGTITGEGIVTVATPVATGDAIVAWLSEVDPDALAEAALSLGTGALGGPNPIESALEVLKQWAAAE